MSSAASRMVKARCFLIMNITATLDIMIGTWMGSCNALYSDRISLKPTCV